MVTFRADKDLQPGSEEWANYVKVRLHFKSVVIHVTMRLTAIFVSFFRDFTVHGY